MPTVWVFSIGAAVFLVLATARVIREHGKVEGAAKTWLVVGCVFAVVAIFLGLRS